MLVFLCVASFESTSLRTEMVERLSERNTASPLLWRGGEGRRGEERKMRRRGERGEDESEDVKL